MQDLSNAPSKIGSDPVGLILCSQNRFSREGLRHILNGEKLSVVGEANSVMEARSLLLLTDKNVRLLICEASSTIGDDLGEMAIICREFPDLALVILADCTNQDDLNTALAAGVSGYLPKDISSAALQISLELILLGEQIVPMPALLRTALSKPQPVMQQMSELRSPLSTREAQILACLEDGLANKRIARDLQMAEATVKVHIKAILRKIQVDNRTQAAVWSMNNRHVTNELRN
jgi:two-component system, NarL family, nitrate/nitrite response regulator NarL